MLLIYQSDRDRELPRPRRPTVLGCERAALGDEIERQRFPQAYLNGRSEIPGGSSQGHMVRCKPSRSRQIRGYCGSSRRQIFYRLQRKTRTIEWRITVRRYPYPHCS